MHFDQSDLRQLTPEYLKTLSAERVVVLFEQLRQDLIVARDRLNQNPSNSSRPSSTRAPWDRKPNDQDFEDEKDYEESSDFPRDSSSDDHEPNESEDPQEDDSLPTSDPEKTKDPKGESLSSKKGREGSRKPGKQKGAQGFGRTQKVIPTHLKILRPECCKGCSKVFDADSRFEAIGGYHVLDISPPEPGKIGVIGTCTKYTFGTTFCECGFETTCTPYKAEKEPGWSVEMGEWRLIGSMLLSFIVFAKLRLHLTISKTRELLQCWFGISLSKGTINNALSEAGRAVSYLEPELLAALRASGLLHVDETSWKEHKICRWLWVAVGEQVTYFCVGARTLEMARRIIGDFTGKLMTDGYNAYRWYQNRGRCWSHLTRKGKALQESWDKDTSDFGNRVVKAFKAMQDSVYKMREMRPEDRKKEAAAADETRIGIIFECLKQVDIENEKARAFAGEVLNDKEAIFRVLSEPEFPLTNNAAEQALRPLVILRKISYGTKTDEGSRAVAILASVSETVRRRGNNVWSFLTTLFKARKSGCSPPPLPVPVAISF